MFELVDRLENKVVSWLEKYGHYILRNSLALIFIWFGLLKHLGISPDEELLRKTLYWLAPEDNIQILGWWEGLIGLCLLLRSWIRIALILMLAQALVLLSSLFIASKICFLDSIFLLSPEGQVTIMHLVLIGAAISVGAKIRMRHRIARGI